MHWIQVLRGFGTIPRCDEPELLDADGLPEASVAQAYRQIQMVHRWLGNTRAILRLLRSELEGIQAPHDLRLLDIGCGQGALLKEIERKLGFSGIGIDLRPAPGDCPIPIVTGNAVLDLLPSADVAICVVMAHHLSGVEVSGLIQNVSRSCNRLILLDLVRHPVPLLLFRLFIAPLLCRINALDGQTSIRRAFTAAEMRILVESALAAGMRPVRCWRHTVSSLWIRQIVDIAWEPEP